MSEWDFLHGLEGQDLVDAMSTGATAEEWAWIEAQDSATEPPTSPLGGTQPRQHRSTFELPPSGR